MTPYPKYKPSGIEWIGDIPEEWGIERLKYAAVVQPSNVDKKSVEGEPDVLLCNYVDVYKNEFIDDSIDFMKATATQSQIEKYRLEIGDVLITKDSETPTDIAVPALVKIEKDNLICGYHLSQIKPDRNKLIGGYLFRLFQSKDFNRHFEMSANGITRFAIGSDEVNNVTVFLPPIPEQNKISNFLDQKTSQIDLLISNKQKLIDLLKEEKTAIINEAVTKGIDHAWRQTGKNVKLKPSGIEWLGDVPEHWEVKKLKYVVSKIDEEIDSSDFIIAVEDIENNSGRLVENITEKNYQGQLNKFIKNDVIFNKLRPYLAKVYLAERDGAVYGELLILRGNTQVDQGFLFYRMFSSSFISEVNSSTEGSKMPRANWEDFIKNLSIAIPNITEQERIAQFLKDETSKIDHAISRIEKEIELMQEYRSALISEVVTGKVRIPLTPEGGPSI